MCHPLVQDGLINMSSARAGLSVYMTSARAGLSVNMSSGRAGWSYKFVIR